MILSFQLIEVGEEHHTEEVVPCEVYLLAEVCLYLAVLTSVPVAHRDLEPLAPDAEELLSSSWFSDSGELKVLIVQRLEVNFTQQW